MWLKGLKIHRIISWILVLLSLFAIILGYATSRRWWHPYDFYIFLHLVIDWILIGLAIIHIFLSRKYMKLSIRRMLKGLKSEKAATTNALRLIQRITKIAILVLAIFVGLSGLIYYWWFAIIFTDIFPFTWHLDLDLALIIFIIIHAVVGSKFFFIRKKVKPKIANILVLLLSSSLIITILSLNIRIELFGYSNPTYITIGNQTHIFDPNEVETQRLDLFQNGSISIYDILYHLNSTGEIDMVAQFNTSLDTWTIDSINGQKDWWYHVYYTGGYGGEMNAVRIDQYPWKWGTSVTMYQESSLYINAVYSTFEEEVSRLANNNGSIVIPVVTIDGSTFNEEFYNVTIYPHNIRNGTLQNDVITALDVIMTLGDLGYITYELKWITSFRGASYVRNYFVNRINSDETYGRCGFVYEVGDEIFKYPGPNYIYLASDVRILTSPDYLRFFWDCL